MKKQNSLKFPYINFRLLLLVLLILIIHPFCYAQGLDRAVEALFTIAITAIILGIVFIIILYSSFKYVIKSELKLKYKVSFLVWIPYSLLAILLFFIFDLNVANIRVGQSIYTQENDLSFGELLLSLYLWLPLSIILICGFYYEKTYGNGVLKSAKNQANFKSDAEIEAENNSYINDEFS